VSIPSRAQAAGLLLDLSPPPRLLRHSIAVAEVAAFLADRALRHGAGIDRRIVEAAGLLHDLDKALPRTHPLRELGHGHAGARWLVEHGLPELAPAVKSHPVGRLSEPGYEAWIRNATWEERIVAYADKRAIQRLVPIDTRFARWLRGHPDLEPSLRLARSRAEVLEREVCGLAGVSPAEVRRLRWVKPALGRAVRETAA
jgi:putative nucleotidyltransferase with HDIG domain